MPTHTDDICEFLNQHYPAALDWPCDALLRWVEWTSSEGFLAVARHEGGEIAGVAIARPVKRWNDGADTTAFDQEGDTIFIDMVVTTEPKVFPFFAMLMKRRFGVRNWLAFRRGLRSANAPIKVYPYERARRMAFRKELQLHGVS